MRKNTLFFAILGSAFLLQVTLSFAAQPTDVPTREKSVKEMARQRDASEKVARDRAAQQKSDLSKEKTWVQKDGKWAKDEAVVEKKRKQQELADSRFKRREEKKARKKEATEKKRKAAESQAAESTAE